MGTPRRPELPKGTTFGAWSVMRLVVVDGFERYRCKASCCGVERVMRRNELEHATETTGCIRCRPQCKRKKVSNATLDITVKSDAG